MRDLLSGFLLLAAIACGGYAYGTPGNNFWTSAGTGAFAMIFVLTLDRGQRD